jgi:hypothetical protein
MSDLKLSELKRLALWQAHHRKCVYCGEPITLGELDIDHILPGALQNSESEMARITSEFALSADFDLNSFLNLVPTHHRCNLQKRDRLFNAPTARYFLDLASGKERTVRHLEEQLALQSKKERLLSAVRVALERGNVATADLLDTAQAVGTFRLATTIPFEDEDVTMIDQHQIEALLDKSIVDDFLLTNSTGHEITIRTCREYKTATDAGYYPRSNVDNKFATTTLLSAYTILTTLANAKVPTISYISNPFCGVADLKLLPQNVLPYIGGASGYDDFWERTSSSKGSLQELARDSWMNRQSGYHSLRPANREEADDDPGFQIIDVSSTHLHFQSSYDGAILEELLRADIDNDGFEEVLVRRYSYAVGGTLGYGQVGVLRRSEPDTMFQFTLL